MGENVEVCFTDAEWVTWKTSRLTQALRAAVSARYEQHRRFLEGCANWEEYVHARARLLEVRWLLNLLELEKPDLTAWRSYLRMVEENKR